MRCFSFIISCFLVSFGLFAQNDQLARNYLDQAEYEKALKTYQQLLKQNPGNSTYFYGVITAYQQMEDFSTAEELLLERKERTPNNPNLLIELGYNASLQRQEEKAGDYYREAIAQLEENPNYAYSVARTF